MNENLNSEFTSKRFYFLVNPKSGDGEGAQIMQLSNTPLLTNSFPDYISFGFINLFDKQQFRNTLQRIRTETQLESRQIYLIICGGDGTVSWVLNEMVKNKLKLSSVVFGLFPIGTGNDMCRSLGWDLNMFEISTGSIIKLVKKWIQSRVTKYDIWEVTLQTFKNGKIYNIASKVQIEVEGNKLTKVFTNYVGLSMDARVVYTMERFRTTSACINKILYGLVGCINFFRPLKELYRKVNIFTDKCHAEREISGNYYPNTEIETNFQIFKDLKENQKASLNSTNIAIKKGYRGMVCLNCPSYMCGLNKVWGTNKIASREPIYEWKPQNFNDGMVEFVGYKTQLSLALQRICRSGAKISQGCGPFEITMNRPEVNEIQYMQIDGQSIKIRNLRSIKINKCSLIPESKINILISS